MRCNVKNWVPALFVCGLTMNCWITPALAAEDQAMSPAGAREAEAAARDGEESRVVFETEGDFFLGYRWVETEDSLKAAEFIDPDSSLAFGLNLLSCPLPWRYHVNAEFTGKHDFYSDAGFAYRDLILFRDVLVGVHHNLEHYNYQFSGEPPELFYSDRDPNDAYSLDFVNNLMSLRLKAPDFPFHAFVGHRHVEREGRLQQRFLLGYFDDQLNLVSESRSVDWKSNAVKLGANSHLGPLELEYVYDQAEFDPGSNNILTDPYNAYNPEPPGIPRPADIYPHNVIPETESSAHSIRMHSSYTGGIVAAATLTSLSQKNNYSLTESTTWKGAFDFSWIPHPVIGLFFKYRHRDVDLDTPAALTLRGADNSVTYAAIRPGISYDKDIFSLSSRYKPLKRLSLFAQYEFTQIEREDVADWELLSSQVKVHAIDLTAHARVTDKATVKAIYEYKNYDQSSYNTSPDNSNKLKFITTYIPAPWFNIYLEYILYLADHDPLLYFVNSDPAQLLLSGEREGRQDQALASLTATISPRLSMTFSWFYQRWDVDQDLAYGRWSDSGEGAFPPFRDFGVPYTDQANSFSVGFQWLPLEGFSVAGDITHTIAKGTTGYTDVVGGADYALAAFSDVEATETGFTLDLAKKISEAWEIGVRSYLNIYNDRDCDQLDGHVFMTTFALKRYF